MRYIVVTRCYWNGRLYNRGEVVDLDPAIEAPEHFKAAEPVEEAKPEPASEEVAKPEPADDGGSKEAPKKPGRRKKG